MGVYPLLHKKMSICENPVILVFIFIDIYNKMNVDLYVIGGAYVYNQCLQMDLIDEAYVTVVETVVKNADAHIDVNLFKNFNKAEKIKKISDGVTIWKLSK